MNALEMIVKLAEPRIVLDAKLYIDEKNGEPRLKGLYVHDDYGPCQVESIYRYNGSEWQEISLHVYANNRK